MILQHIEIIKEKIGKFHDSCVKCVINDAVCSVVG